MYGPDRRLSRRPAPRTGRPAAGSPRSLSRTTERGRSHRAGSWEASSTMTRRTKQRCPRELLPSATAKSPWSTRRRCAASWRRQRRRCWRASARERRQSLADLAQNIGQHFFNPRSRVIRHPITLRALAARPYITAAIYCGGEAMIADDGALQTAGAVGSDRYCSPRHLTPFDSRNKGLQCG